MHLCPNHIRIVHYLMNCKHIPFGAPVALVLPVEFEELNGVAEVGVVGDVPVVSVN